MADFSTHLKQLANLLGSECVYKEGGLILHVQIKGVNIQKDMIQIILESLPTIGFGKRLNHTFDLESTVDNISFSKNRLYISYIGSELFTGKADVMKIVKFAEDSPDLDAFLKVIQELRRGNRPKKI
jgi:hypothetical protein